MASLPHDQDITSWPQLLSAIEDAEAGQGTARLTEICLSVYSALPSRSSRSPSSRPGFMRTPRPERLTAWRRLITRMRRWRIGLLRPGGPPDARR